MQVTPWGRGFEKLMLLAVHKCQRRSPSVTETEYSSPHSHVFVVGPYRKAECTTWYADVYYFCCIALNVYSIENCLR